MSTRRHQPRRPGGRRSGGGAFLLPQDLQNGDLDAWESVRIELDEFIEAGEYVVVPLTMYGTGRDGIELQARSTWVWTIRDRMIVRVCLYQDKNYALEAAGLRE
jgi:ketosteroid isomerase-like protein